MGEKKPGFQFLVEKRITADGRGLGIFALERIPKVSLVWRSVPGVNTIMFTKEEYLSKLKTLSHDEKVHFIDHAWRIGENFYNSLNDDEALLINHSADANIAFSDADPNCYFSVREIGVGEELMEDYSKFSWDRWFYNLHKSIGLDLSFVEGLEAKFA